MNEPHIHTSLNEVNFTPIPTRASLTYFSWLTSNYNNAYWLLWKQQQQQLLISDWHQSYSHRGEQLWVFTLTAFFWPTVKRHGLTLKYCLLHCRPFDCNVYDRQWLPRVQLCWQTHARTLHLGAARPPYPSHPYRTRKWGERGEGTSPLKPADNAWHVPKVLVTLASLQCPCTALYQLCYELVTEVLTSLWITLRRCTSRRVTGGVIYLFCLAQYAA